MSLTADAAAALDGDGRLRLPAPVPAGPDPEVTGETAAALGTAWGRDFGPYHGQFLREFRGGPIAFKTLAACGRPLYARAAVEPPSRDMKAGFRRQYGSWWLVTLCSPSGEPQVSVAVSAWATNLKLSDGHIRFSAGGDNGGEFFGMGTPRGHTGEYPATPEVAVARAARVSGARVAAVPDLLMPTPDQAPPQGAHWVVRLDRTVALRGARAAAPDARVYVAAHSFTQAGDTAFVAAPAQPAAFEARWAAPELNETPAQFKARYAVRAERLARRADVPLRFERITVTGGQ